LHKQEARQQQKRDDVTTNHHLAFDASFFILLYHTHTHIHPT